MRYLASEVVPSPEVLGVQDGARPQLLKLLQAVDGGHVGHAVVAVGDHDGIEPFHPPVVLLAAVLAQGDLPLVADLFDALNSGAVRDEVLVAVALEQALDVAADDLPVAKGRVLAVQGDGGLAAHVGHGLFAEGHGDRVDVGLQIGVDGRI